MANGVFDLDSMLEESDAEYGSTKIPVGDGVVVELRNVLRLSKEERAQFNELLPTNGDDEIDGEALLDVMPKLIALLADDAVGGVEKLLERVGDRADVLLLIFKNYMEDQKAGKAEPSQS